MESREPENSHKSIHQPDHSQSIRIKLFLIGFYIYIYIPILIITQIMTSIVFITFILITIILNTIHVIFKLINHKKL